MWVPDCRKHALDAILEDSSSTPGTPADTAFDLWEDYTDHQLFLASTSDPLEFSAEGGAKMLANHKANPLAKWCSLVSNQEKDAEHEVRMKVKCSEWHANYVLGKQGTEEAKRNFGST